MARKYPFGRRKWSYYTDRGIAEGYRSGLEDTIQRTLTTLKVKFTYEPFKIPYVPLKLVKSYTPDFLLLANYIVIESKGRFLTADRQKMKAVRQQYPDLDLRFVFSNANARISKNSKTTYAAWCESNGFRYATGGSIPDTWLNEPVSEKSRAVIQKLQAGESD